MNSSASGGYLYSAEDITIDDVEQALGDMFAGVTNLSRDLIRPMWQTDTPLQPDIGVDWVAFGITEEVHSYSPVKEPVSVGQFLSTRCTVHTYGPNASTTIGQIRDGFFIGQNREQLYDINVKFTDTSGIRRLPELYNNKWYNRWLMHINLVRATHKTYNILTFASGGVSLYAEGKVDLPVGEDGHVLVKMIEENMTQIKRTPVTHGLVTREDLNITPAKLKGIIRDS